MAAANERIQFNVRGTTFITYRRTLDRFPNTRLASLSIDADNFIQEENSYFFDRDPDIFNVVLNYYQWGEIHIPKHLCGATFRRELEFWNISDVNVAKCCWQTYYQYNSDLTILDQLAQVEAMYKDGVDPNDENEAPDADDINGRDIDGDLEGTANNANMRNATHAIWTFLNNPQSSMAAKVGREKSKFESTKSIAGQTVVMSRYLTYIGGTGEMCSLILS
jgi:hypothetical protein